MLSKLSQASLHNAGETTAQNTAETLSNNARSSAVRTIENDLERDRNPKTSSTATVSRNNISSAQTLRRQTQRQPHIGTSRCEPVSDSVHEAGSEQHWIVHDPQSPRHDPPHTLRSSPDSASQITVPASTLGGDSAPRQNCQSRQTLALRPSLRPIAQQAGEIIVKLLQYAGITEFNGMSNIHPSIDQPLRSVTPSDLSSASSAPFQNDGSADAAKSKEPIVVPPSAYQYPLAPGFSLLQYSSMPIEEAETIYLPQIRHLISTDLSEPYSIYVYRYFLYQWAELCFMAIDDTTGKMIGVVISKLEVHRGGPLRGYIAMLATKKECRGRGLATRLVAESVDEMIRRGADEVALETEVSNTTSLKLYERLGFLRSKRLHRYYLNGNTAFRLLLYLKEGTAAKETFPPEIPPLSPEEGDVQGYIPI